MRTSVAVARTIGSLSLILLGASAQAETTYAKNMCAHWWDATNSQLVDCDAPRDPTTTEPFYQLTASWDISSGGQGWASDCNERTFAPVGRYCDSWQGTSGVGSQLLNLYATQWQSWGGYYKVQTFTWDRNLAQLKGIAREGVSDPDFTGFNLGLNAPFTSACSDWLNWPGTNWFMCDFDQTEVHTNPFGSVYAVTDSDAGYTTWVRGITMYPNQVGYAVDAWNTYTASSPGEYSVSVPISNTWNMSGTGGFNAVQSWVADRNHVRLQGVYGRGAYEVMLEPGQGEFTEREAACSASNLDVASHPTDPYTHCDLDEDLAVSFDGTYVNNAVTLWVTLPANPPNTVYYLVRACHHELAYQGYDCGPWSSIVENAGSSGGPASVVPDTSIFVNRYNDFKYVEAWTSDVNHTPRITGVTYRGSAGHW